MLNVRRIVVIAPAQLGDVLLLTPLIAAAHARWPAAAIDLLGFANTMALLEGHPDVGQCIAIDRSAGLRGQLRQAWRLRRRYDIALVTRTSDRSHLYGWVLARRRSALVPDGGPGSGWKRRAAQHAFSLFPRRHQVLEKLQLMSPWAEPAAAISLHAPAAAALPPALSARLDRPTVVVQVPSMWRYKQWPAEHYRSVVQSLLADGLQVLLTGSASAADREQVDAVAAGIASADLLDLTGTLTLAQTGTLLRQVDLYIGPDTSVTHLAAAVGVPLVTVFGPTDPQDFGPWPAGHAPEQPWQQRAWRQQVAAIVVLQGPDLPQRQCVPCNRMGCEHHHASRSQCLLGIEPGRVVEAARQLLAAHADERAAQRARRAVSAAA